MMRVSAQTARISKNSADYPAMLQRYLGDRAPNAIWVLGNLDLIQHEAIALFCSVKCPGNLILKTYDLARSLRDDGVSVISGFHSPMEKKCLDLLLRGKQPVIWCFARRLMASRLLKKYSVPIEEGRLLMISPFGEKTRRVTKDSSNARNEFVAALADQIFVAYAAPGSKTEALCKKVIGWEKPLLTFDTFDNNNLLTLGAKPYFWYCQK